MALKTRKKQTEIPAISHGARQVLLFSPLERVAPDLVLPRVEIQWTRRELGESGGTRIGRGGDKPTAALRRAMRD